MFVFVGRALVRVADTDLVPVCAIEAGILGQEVIKAISPKDEPICSYFCFDGVTCSRRRGTIGETNSSPGALVQCST